MTTAWDDDEPLGEVVPLRPDLDAEVVLAEPVAVEAPAGLRGRVVVLAERHHLPSARQAVASLGWWAGQLVRIAPWLPVLLLAELRPIGRGIGRACKAWSAWVSVKSYAATVPDAEGKDRHKAQDKVEARKSARTRLSAVIGLVLLGSGAYLVLVQPLIAVAVAVGLAALFDAMGRRGPDGATPHITLPTGPIAVGMSLSSLRAEVSSSFEAQGVEVAVDMPRPVDNGWTVDYHSRAAIEDEHLRQLERDLNVRRGGITQIVERGAAARGQLQVMLVDPLAAVIDSPEPEGLTIYRPLPLGRTASGAEWVENFLRTHFAEIGASQSGKSSGFWQITDVLRRCPEVEVDAIDLTDGPAFGATRRAFRRRAFDEESALRLLKEAVALCKERNAELQRRAEADDTPDDFEEKWQPTAEHPQRVILIDEVARVTEIPELLKLVEYVLRYGAKAAVVLGLAGQGGTLADFGTSVVRGQVMLKILFACSRADVLYLFGKDARDAGYRPDLFEPANGSAVNDAGKCFVMSATSRTPEPRRAYRLDLAEVRRRDRELGGRARVDVEAVDAVEVPQILADVQAAFAGRGWPEHFPTKELLAALGTGISEKKLADLLRPHRVGPKQHPQTKARGYYAAHVRAALEAL